jgi:hypothetical protein
MSETTLSAEVEAALEQGAEMALDLEAASDLLGLQFPATSKAVRDASYELRGILATLLTALERAARIEAAAKRMEDAVRRYGKIPAVVNAAHTALRAALNDREDG